MHTMLYLYVYICMHMQLILLRLNTVYVPPSADGVFPTSFAIVLENSDRETSTLEALWSSNWSQLQLAPIPIDAPTTAGATAAAGRPGSGSTTTASSAAAGKAQEQHMRNSGMPAAASTAATGKGTGKASASTAAAAEAAAQLAADAEAAAASAAAAATLELATLPFGQFSLYPCTGTIAPGAVVPVTLTFKPHGSGVRHETLRVLYTGMQPTHAAATHAAAAAGRESVTSSQEETAAGLVSISNTSDDDAKRSVAGLTGAEGTHTAAAATRLSLGAAKPLLIDVRGDACEPHLNSGDVPSIFEECAVFHSLSDIGHSAAPSDDTSTTASCFPESDDGAVGPIVELRRPFYRTRTGFALVENTFSVSIYDTGVLQAVMDITTRSTTSLLYEAMRFLSDVDTPMSIVATLVSCMCARAVKL